MADDETIVRNAAERARERLRATLVGEVEGAEEQLGEGVRAEVHALLSQLDGVAPEPGDGR